MVDLFFDVKKIRTCGMHLIALSISNVFFIELRGDNSNFKCLI
jgi:hypothetical protein